MEEEKKQPIVAIQVVDVRRSQRSSSIVIDNRNHCDNRKHSSSNMSIVSKKSKRSCMSNLSK